MEKNEFEYFKKLLLSKREETVEELSELQETSQNKEGSGQNSAYPSHMAELGTDAQENEKRFMFVQRLNSYLTYLDEALYRIEKKTFGICTSCNQEISRERLEAVPQTQLCVECKLKSK